MYLGRCFNYASKLRSIATKVVVNQVVFTPVFLSSFFGMHSLLSGDGPTEAWDRIKRTLPTSLINSCKLWPAVTAFSFTYVSPPYRALFAGKAMWEARWIVMEFADNASGGVAVFWQAYLSWLNQHATR